jgi:hypothetical protein
MSTFADRTRPCNAVTHFFVDLKWRFCIAAPWRRRPQKSGFHQPLDKLNLNHF